jgi:hypothetical protein
VFVVIRAGSRNTSILASLSDNPTAYNKRIRRGRGPASGKGKTSGRLCLIMEDDLHVHAAALAVHDDVLCLATIEARWDPSTWQPSTSTVSNTGSTKAALTPNNRSQ